jgi:hypothetical protein
MADFLVCWEINIEAATAREAAREALRIMQDKSSTATVFDVFEGGGDKVRIDLQDEKEGEQIT